MCWKRWEIALAASILAAILFCAFPAQAQSALADKLVRLHVLANSDSEEDQALKLQVRDAVLAASAGAAVLDDALLAQLQRAAQRTVWQAGRQYQVRVSRENCWFDTRVYEDFSLPAGYYDAVRVVIGAGEGHNWWCVIYPPLCAGACETDVETLAREAGLSEDEVGLICGEDGYAVRFRLAELWGQLLHWLKG